MFCSNCGKQTVQGAKFCSNCGNLIETDREFLMGEKNNESVQKPLMVLHGGKKEGIIKQTEYFLVFFPTNIIFAIFSKDIQNREMKRLREKLKADGTGFFKSSAEMMKFWANYGDKYYQMTEMEILNEEKSNFTIENSKIKKIKFTASENQQYEENSSTRIGEMIIETNGERIKIKHKYFDSNRNIKKVLENIYGNKLKYKGRGISINLGRKEGFY